MRLIVSLLGEYGEDDLVVADAMRSLSGAQREAVRAVLEIRLQENEDALDGTLRTLRRWTDRIEACEIGVDETDDVAAIHQMLAAAKHDLTFRAVLLTIHREQGCVRGGVTCERLWFRLKEDLYEEGMLARDRLETANLLALNGKAW